MKTTLKRSDPDFDEWSVKFNGELLCHDTLVSADAITGAVVRRSLDADGRLIAGEYETRGLVRFIERNEAVRDKEPVLRGQPIAPVEPKVAEDAPQPEPEPEAEASEPAGEEAAEEGRKPLGRVTIKKN